MKVHHLCNWNAIRTEKMATLEKVMKEIIPQSEKYHEPMI